MDPVESEMSSCPMETNECDDAESIVVASSTISDGFSTPASGRTIPFCVTSWTPECDDARKPAIGMEFKDLGEAEQFYKSYAHTVGFSVRKGHASVVFTHKVFDALQKEILAAREYCVVESMRHEGDEKITVISDGRSSKVREVVLNTTTMDAHCTCKLFKSHGIPCRHVILVLRGARIEELPSQFVLKRWTKMCKKEAIFDEDGNLLEEKPKSPVDLAMQKKSSGARKDFEESIRLAAHSTETMDIVTTCLANLVVTVRQMVPADKQTRKDEFQSFLGCSIPDHIEIFPPSDVRSPGKCKRLKGHLDKGAKKNKNEGNKEKGKTTRMCSLCHQLGTHDKRTCPTKSTQ